MTRLRAGHVGYRPGVYGSLILVGRAVPCRAISGLIARLGPC